MADLPRTADVVVVGGGVHGASVAYHLAHRRAGRVVLVERKFLASGPTGRSSALVRRFYAMDFLTRTGQCLRASIPAVVRRDRRRRPGLPSGRDPLARRGPTGRPTSRENVRRARALGVQVNLLTPGELKALVPAITLDDLAVAAHEPESGYADAASTTNALAASARELGATIVQHVPVEALLVAGSRVTGVRTAAAGDPGADRGRLRRALGAEPPRAARHHRADRARRATRCASSVARPASRASRDHRSAQPARTCGPRPGT